MEVHSHFKNNSSFRDISTRIDNTHKISIPYNFMFYNLKKRNNIYIYYTCLFSNSLVKRPYIDFFVFKCREL